MPALWLAVVFLLALTCPLRAATLPGGAAHAAAASPLAKDVTVAEDPGGTLTLDDVIRAPESFHAKPATASIAAMPYRYWLRFTVTNDTEHDVVDQVIPDTWDVADLWFVASSGTVIAAVQHAGNLVPVRDAEEPFPTVRVHAGERVTVYAHVGWFGRFSRPQFRAYINPEIEYLEHQQLSFWIDGIILGVLLGLAINSLIIFGSTRDASYIWYPVYLLAIGLSFAGQFGTGPSHLTRWLIPDHPLLSIVVKRFSDPIAWMALVQFARSFFRTRETMRRWDDALIGTIVMIAFLFLIYIFVPAVNPWQLWLWDIAAVMCLITAVLAQMRGLGAPYFLIGQALVSFGSFASSMAISGRPIFTFLGSAGIWDYFQGTRVVWVFAVFDALIFSFALADRFRRIEVAAAAADLAHQVERTRLVHEQNERLEATVMERTNELRTERDTSDRLLANILPASIADELKRDGSAQPSRFDEASILFTDFKDFTTISGLMPPKKVVDELDDLFKAFDDIIDANGLEKIKTIGDAYMAAAGVPVPCADHAERATRAAIQMLDHVAERNRSAAVKWEMRAGIHSGTVIAGVVGKRKFTYDVWGDTVNIASRVEANGEPGHVCVSAYTYDLVKAAYACAYRGKISLKGKGDIDMYAVTGTA